MGSQTEAAGERLSRTSLRDFKPPVPADEPGYDLPSYKITFSAKEAPIPVLLRHALDLVGISHTGPAEKVAWWSSFVYKGYSSSLAHQKFGLRLRIRGELNEEEAMELLAEMRKKLLSAVKTVEEHLVEMTHDTLNAGNVTVVNQHQQLRRAYDYFRQRATNPEVVEDVSERGETEFGSWSSFRSGRKVMAINSFHDLVAAISAFLSSLEHDLVLALPFLDFSPSTDDLTEIIGNRWGEKWRRVVGHVDPEAVRLRQQLAAVVERWRNPYSHGGFEKGHGATIYVHTPGLGALPVGLSGIRDSPLFSFHPASETDIEAIFTLFDAIDAYLARTRPHAMNWIESGLDVQFDAEFRAEVVARIESFGDLDRMIEAHSSYQDMVNNMDF